jgi:hypothetical protein
VKAFRTLAQDSTYFDYRYVLICLTRRRGLTQGVLGDAAGAAAGNRRAVELCGGLLLRSGFDLFVPGYSNAALAGRARQTGAGGTAAQGKGEGPSAMHWLRRAVAVGYRNFNEIRIDPALDPLRSRDDFRLLMMDVVFPAEPFVR